MRRAVLLAIALAPAAGAVTVECPQHHPAHAAGPRLIGAGMYAGPWEQKAELIGDPTKVTGGYDTRFGFNAGDEKWLVCHYGKGGEIQWRQQMDRAITGCTLEARGRGQVTARLVCTATKRAG